MQQQQSAGGMSQSGIGRCPSTIVTFNVSQERINRGGARPIFPSSVALPTLQNVQRLQQQAYSGMQQGSTGGLQQGSMGGLQQGSMGGVPQGSLGGQTQQGIGGQPQGHLVQLQLALLQQQQQQPQGSLGGLMQGSALPGATQGVQGMPSVVGQGSLGGSGGIGGLLQQDQLSSLLGGGAGSHNPNLFGGQQSSLLSALQNQQGGMLSGQGSGGQLGGGLLPGSLSSSPQVGLLGAGLMASSQGLSPQKSQCTLGGLGAFGGSSVLPTSRASKPLLQAMETLKGGAPGVQGIVGAPAGAGSPAPIVMSQPVTSAGLAPQMQHLLLRGMPGYTSTLVLILVPQD
ncbi:uncharacterized protein LOC144166647 [Haemaphysalis longicornis]